jgi:hypothetical protein
MSSDTSHGCYEYRSNRPNTGAHVVLVISAPNQNYWKQERL